MRKTILTLSIGMLIGLMAGSLPGAFAAVTETVQAQFSKFSLVINKSESIEIEPLTYKGSTYLPVREMANLLGYDLTYKADSRTIELSKSVESLSSEFEKIIATEGDEVVGSDPDVKSIEDKLRDLEIAIESTEHSLRLGDLNLASAIESKFSDEVIQSIRDGIKVTEQRLEKFKAQKADLERQLAELQN